jgi:hypothetical protein
VYDKDGIEKENVICAVYQQYNGYLSGVGKQIADFLEPIEIVNGISSYDKPIANGIRCLAAQFIKKFKTEAGGLYITSHEDEQSYNYDIIVGWESSEFLPKPTQPIVRVTSLGGKLFEGTVSEFVNFLDEEQDNEE